MKRILWLVLMLLSLASWRAQATTVTGTLKGPDGVVLTGTLYLSFSQQVSVLSTGGCGGPILVPPNVQAKVAITNGTVTSTSIYGLNCISPSTNVYHHAVFIDSQSNKIFDVQWNCITGSSVDLGGCVPVQVNPTTTIIQGPVGPQGPAVAALAQVELTGQNAQVGTTLLYALGATGFYEACAYLPITTPGSGGIIQPGVFWNDGYSIKSLALGNANAGISNSIAQGCVRFRGVSGQNVSYFVQYSGVTGTPVWTVDFSLTRLW